MTFYRVEDSVVMKIENMHVKTNDFIADVDLDADGFGRIYYFVLGEHAQWTPQSEFLEITPDGAHYSITHQDGGHAGLRFKENQVEILDLKNKEMPTAVANGLVKENKALLDSVLGLQMDQDDLAENLFKTILKKQQFIL